MRLKRLYLPIWVIAGLAATFSVAAAANIDIPYTEHTLDNGLRLIVHEDDKAPIVAVNIWYHVGSKNEKTGKTGFAHLFEHLMFNGSENYNDEYFKTVAQWARPIRTAQPTSIGPTIFRMCRTPRSIWRLWMESDRMGHLLGAVTEESLDEQRGVVQNEKRQGENQPYGKVYDHIFRGLFPASTRTPGCRSARWRT